MLSNELKCSINGDHYLGITYVTYVKCLIYLFLEPPCEDKLMVCMTVLILSGLKLQVLSQTTLHKQIYPPSVWLGLSSAFYVKVPFIG